jgi:NitT/TauT family transport system permease protein
MKTAKHLLLLALLWQVVYLVVGNALMWPSLDDVVVTMTNLLVNNPGGRFYLAIMGSLKSLSITISIIVLLTVVVTLLGLMCDFVKETLTTWASMFGPVPAFTWLPIFFILFGMGVHTVYILCVWTSVWFVFLQIFGQVDTAKKTWLPQVKNLELSNWQALTQVYIPSIIPTFISGVKISWNHTWRIIFAVEIAFGNLGGQHGLGVLMSDYRGEFENTEVYALLLIVMLIGITVNKLLDLLEVKIKWQ